MSTRAVEASDHASRGPLPDHTESVQPAVCEVIVTDEPDVTHTNNTATCTDQDGHAPTHHASNNAVSCTPTEDERNEGGMSDTVSPGGEAVHHSGNVNTVERESSTLEVDGRHRGGGAYTKKRSGSVTSRTTLWGPMVPGETGRLHDNYVLQDVNGTRRRLPDGANAVVDDDLARIDSLTDDLLIETLEQRLKTGRIYTYIGDILIAVNPYSDTGLYTADHSLLYTGVVDPSALAPHIFAVADRCYSALVRTNMPQMCVISGESGAGKTESTKLFIRQVLDISNIGAVGRTVVATSEHASLPRPPTPAKPITTHPVESKILMLNPILESFGNARTVMNDNSSRFGKLVELVFDDRGNVVGARLAHYLLEKARLVVQGPGESNFHIFRQFLDGGDPELLRRFHVEPETRYRILLNEMGHAPHTNATDAGPGTDTASLSTSPSPSPAVTEEWLEVMESLRVVGISDVQLEEILGAITSILLLGNVQCSPDADGDGSVVDDTNSVNLAASALAVPPEALVYCLTKSEISTRGETIVKGRMAEQAGATRDALLKSVYERLFTWIVRKLDDLLRPSTPHQNVGTTSGKIGILDIFGFEDFPVNSFGQMCINLANERLHLFFYKHVFQAELQSYAEEGLDAASIDPSDNTDVIRFFVGRPVGLISLLDEESRFPQATPRSLVEKFDANLKMSTSIFAASPGQATFSVTHFAGVVKYNANDFLEANRDPLAEDTIKLLSKSASLLMSELFHPTFLERPNEGCTKTKGGGGPPSRSHSRFTSLSTRFFKGASRRDGGGPSSRRQGGQGAPRMAHTHVSTVSTTTTTTTTSITTGAASRPIKSRRAARQAPTVASSFLVSLDHLLIQMDASTPHFVRCIKPNNAKDAGRYDHVYVRRQLNYCGMLETVKIRREGFSHRILYSDFFQMYHGIAFPYTTARGHSLQSVFRGPPNDAQRDLLRKVLTVAETQCVANAPTAGGLTLSGWQIGKTRVFLKYWHVDLLNMQLLSHERAAIRLQLYFRGLRDRRAYIQRRDVARRERTEATEFLALVSESSRELLIRQQCANDEDERRGPFGLPEASIRARHESARGNIPGTKIGLKIAAKNKKSAWRWWMRHERPRHVHLDEYGRVCPWFHGQIHRNDAEALLWQRQNGTYLVRVSDRDECYALSLWFGMRVRHYRILREEGRYRIFGEMRNHEFSSLAELIEYHTHVDISVSVGDTLSIPLPIGTQGPQHIHHGLAEELELTDEGIDPCALVKTDEPELPPVPPARLRSGSRMSFASRMSVASHIFMEGAETEVNPIDPNSYLRPATVAGYDVPSWLHGNIDREEANALISGPDKPDGTFVVRAKLFTSMRVVYVLSYHVNQRIYHHKLEWAGVSWKIEKVDTGFTGPLEELIEHCMLQRISMLWARLVDPSASPSSSLSRHTADTATGDTTTGTRPDFPLAAAADVSTLPGLSSPPSLPAATTMDASPSGSSMAQRPVPPPRAPPPGITEYEYWESLFPQGNTTTTTAAADPDDANTYAEPMGGGNDADSDVNSSHNGVDANDDARDYRHHDDAHGRHTEGRRRRQDVHDSDSDSDNDVDDEDDEDGIPELSPQPAPRHRRPPQAAPRVRQAPPEPAPRHQPKQQRHIVAIKVDTHHADDVNGHGASALNAHGVLHKGGGGGGGDLGGGGGPEIYEMPVPLHSQPPADVSPTDLRPEQRNIKDVGLGRAFGAAGAGVTGVGNAFYTHKVVGRASNEAQLVRHVKRGHLRRVRAILEAGDVNVNAIRRYGSGRTALHQAALAGNHAMVELLLQYGADPTTRDTAGQSVVSAAANAGHHDIVLTLKRATSALRTHMHASGAALHGPRFSS
eukprot:m.95710 g.95710  ORF g.95710 m.95710 type:complete len:1845 (-) comp10120_c1_seq2:251-5785(-)